MVKITILGAGHVGSQAAFAIVRDQLADVVILDINEGVAKGVVLDIQQATALMRHAVSVDGGSDYSKGAGSDVIVIAAGLARRAGMTRQDLFECNAKVVCSVAEQALQFSPDAILVVVTNPVNLMAQLVFESTGLPRERVIGMAGILDNARFRTRVAVLSGAPVQQVESLVAGDHGDRMVPLISQTSVAGKPLAQVLSPAQISDAVTAARKGGTEIVNLLKTGSAYFAPGLAVREVIRAIVSDGAGVLSCSTYLEGEYGVYGLYLGVPVRIGAAGMEKVVCLDLSDAERQSMSEAASFLRSHMPTAEAKGLGR